MCIGGLFMRSLGKHHKYPEREHLVIALRKANPVLVGREAAYSFADRLIKHNDSGAFYSAMRALVDALSYRRSA